MSCSNFCFLKYSIPMRGGRNVVMTVFSKHCGRQHKLTVAISNMFIGKLWPTNVRIWTQKNFYIFYPEIN